MSVPERSIENELNKHEPSPLAEMVTTGLHLKTRPVPLKETDWSFLFNLTQNFCAADSHSASDRGLKYKSGAFCTQVTRGDEMTREFIFCDVIGSLESSEVSSGLESESI